MQLLASLCHQVAGARGLHSFIWATACACLVMAIPCRAEELRILRGEQEVDETHLKDYDGGLGPDDGSSGEASDFGDLGSDAGQAGGAGKGVSKDTLRRPLGQAGGGKVSFAPDGLCIAYARRVHFQLGHDG
eukprot:1160186-Pelagomonas_calceolata.AAC.6